MYEHNALGYWSGLTLCLTKVRSSRARCPATALIFIEILSDIFQIISGPFLQRGTSRQRSGKGAIRKRFPLQKPRWEKNQTNNQALIP